MAFGLHVPAIFAFIVRKSLCVLIIISVGECEDFVAFGFSCSMNVFLVLFGIFFFPFLSDPGCRCYGLIIDCVVGVRWVIAGFP